MMVEGTSFMGLGGPNLVKGATGQAVNAEELGGARVHTEISGVAHYRAADDEACLARIRDLIGELPYAAPALTLDWTAVPGREPAELYDLLPADHRQPYDMHEVLACVLDEGGWDVFQADLAPEMMCLRARLQGIPVGVIANARGMYPRPGKPPKLGGIVYTDSAEKVAYFLENLDRHRIPMLFVQDVSGFMVGPEAEHGGIIRAGARFVEAMATATVPKLVLTVNHASGAGYYAMAGQGFDPDFLFTLPTGRMGVMEGESAVRAIFGTELDRLEAEGRTPDADLESRMESVRRDYERQLDARYAAARGFVDAVLTPENLRDGLGFSLWAAVHNPGPHLGAFVLPGTDSLR
ncbi:MAG TPA: carboxyl transferase domain-containing protein, partial [Gemmatimonadota bacterium]|nr:carboxyl transferase domain-containing protein [Gemmatimonadota bacterium]